MTAPVPVLVLVDDGYFGQESLHEELGPGFAVSFVAGAAEAQQALSDGGCPIVLAPRALAPTAGDLVLAELHHRGYDFFGALLVDDQVDRVGAGVQAVIRRPLKAGELSVQLQALASTRQRYLTASAERQRLTGDFVRLAGGLRHDMRGQLQSVVGLASLLLELEQPRRPPDDEMIEFITRIGAAGDRLTCFVDALGDWLAASHRPLEIAAVDLADLVREAVARAHANRGVVPGPEVRDIELQLPDEGVVARVEGDARMLLKACEVLIARASTNKRPVRVRLTRTDAGWELAVYDVLSKQLPPSYGDQIFELFERYGGGDGIGLSMVRQIALRHGVGVRMAAGPAGGHEVVMTFPWST